MKHKEAIGIINREIQQSQHYSVYPQDRWKGESSKTIEVLNETSNYHKKRVIELTKSLDVLATDT